MTERYVYLLSMDGEAARATLDRSMLPAMLLAYRGDDHECHVKLAQLLGEADETLAREQNAVLDIQGLSGLGAKGHKLDDHGIMQLHVVRLSQRQTIVAA